MLYQSTRVDEKRISSAEAIAFGLSKDGGLFVPEVFPNLPSETLNQLVSESYDRRAAYIMSLFLRDFTIDELYGYTELVYGASKSNGFYYDRIVPVYKLNDNTSFLELWHGPTCAFKDMALQIMPLLLSASLKKIGESREVCILVATSGDTGKAALEGFKDVPGTKIMVFYPQDGVSDVQKMQMTSQSGENVNVVAVEGNFDDAQSGVKSVFSDEALRDDLSERGYFLSSANSINWGRLVPQVVYYISAYCDLVKNGSIISGEKINFCVPTGNFGNILAGYYAERIGLPVNRLICASNRNDVLTQFINTGVYDKNRPFYTTVSPSMDILVSSNLERLLFELSGKDGKMVEAYMSKLSKSGYYAVPDSVHVELGRVFSSGYCSEEDTKKTIGDTFKKSGYLIDTHTAVAYKVLGDYRAATGDDTLSVVVSTASPFKFNEAVLAALGQPVEGSGVTMLENLSDVTGCAIPAPLVELKNTIPRFSDTVTIKDMKKAVTDFLYERLGH